MEPFPAFLTRHALTTGIEERRFRESDNGRILDEYGHYCHFEGIHWHRTREAAVTRAYEMRDAEIARLRARIGELEGMKW